MKITDLLKSEDEVGIYFYFSHFSEELPLLHFFSSVFQKKFRFSWFCYRKISVENNTFLSWILNSREMLWRRNLKMLTSWHKQVEMNCKITQQKQSKKISMVLCSSCFELEIIFKNMWWSHECPEYPISHLRHLMPLFFLYANDDFLVRKYQMSGVRTLYYKGNLKKIEIPYNFRIWHHHNIYIFEHKSMK